MNFQHKDNLRILLPLFSALLLLALTACKPAEKVDAAQFDAAKWEQAIKKPGLTEKEFTRLYAQAAAAELKTAEVTVVGPRELAIKLTNGKDLKAFLDNVWNEAQNDAANRPQVVRRYLKALTAAVAGTGKDAELPDTNSIVIVMRDDLFLEQFAKFAKTNGPVYEPFVADIKILYAIDSEGTIQYLSEPERQKLNLSLPALRALATANLQRLLPELKRQGDGPVFMMVADGNYESSLLLANRIWDEQAKSVKGDLVAAIPSRDVLLFTGSDSADGIRELKEAVTRIHASGAHLISKTLLVRRNGKWEQFAQ